MGDTEWRWLVTSQVAPFRLKIGHKVAIGVAQKHKFSPYVLSLFLFTLQIVSVLSLQ